MTDDFFSSPILNSSYGYPARHWEFLGGLPTGRVVDTRRGAEFITPIPRPKMQRRGQRELVLDDTPQQRVPRLREAGQQEDRGEDDQSPGG